MVTILANGLTVALSGLFLQKDVIREQTILVRPRFAPSYSTSRFNETSSELESKEDPFHIVTTNITSNTPLPPWVSPQYYFLPVDLPSELAGVNQSYFVVPTLAIGVDMACEDPSHPHSNVTYQLDLNPEATAFNFSTTYEQADQSTIRCEAGLLNENNVTTIDGMPEGNKGFEYALDAGASDLALQPFCYQQIMRGWIRSNITLAATNFGEDSLRNTSYVSLDSTFISCRAKPKSAPFNVTVDPLGSVVEATVAGPFSVNLETEFGDIRDNTTELFEVDNGFPTWHNDSFATDWANYLIKILTKNSSFVDPTRPPPTFSEATNLMTEVYQRVFAVTLSMKTEGLEPLRNPRLIQATQTFPERRIFMSETMFKIAVIILSIDLVVAILVYARISRPFLPRMPTSIASEVAYFAASYTLKELAESGGDPTTLEREDSRYAFGKFVGTDGWAHVGIDREPFVQPLRRRRKA